MGFSISGLGSGIDWKSLVSQIRQVEQTQLLQPLQDQKAAYESKFSAWGTLSGKLDDFLTAADNIKDSSDFDVYQATLSSSSSVEADSILSATVGSGAAKGRYDIKVLNLAKAEKLQSTGVSSQSSDAGWTGTINIEGHDVTLDGKSLQDLQEEINNLNSGDSPSGVIASVLEVSSSDYRLILTSEDEGAAGFSFTDAAGDYFSTLQAGEDASFSIDGISMTRSSNTVTDAIAGVTLKLKSEDASTTVTMDVDRDQSAITDKIQDFVDKYNAVIGFVNDQFNYDADNEKTGGPLFGDIITRSIKSKLETTVLDAGLYDYGIQFEDDGTITLDQDDLQSAMDSDFNTMVSDFNSVGQSLDTILNDYTDSIDGTVKLQRDSLQDNVDRIDKKISATQDRIDLEMDRLTKQFIAMDSVLNELQSQSSWLLGQLTQTTSSSTSA